MNTQPTDWTETDLLSRMMLRDGTAWREFHRRYDRLIYRCIHKVTGRFPARSPARTSARSTRCSC